MPSELETLRQQVEAEKQKQELARLRAAVMPALREQLNDMIEQKDYVRLASMLMPTVGAKGSAALRGKKAASVMKALSSRKRKFEADLRAARTDAEGLRRQLAEKSPLHCRGCSKLEEANLKLLRESWSKAASCGIRRAAVSASGGQLHLAPQ